MMISRIEDALEDLRAGKVIIVVDDENRENEGDLVVAAEKITPDAVNFMLHHGRGILCTALPKNRCKELELHPMEQKNTSLLGTPFTVSVDYIYPEATTGVASNERAATIKALVCPETQATDLARPGHVFPLQAQEEGVFARQGHTEAVVDLTRIAGLKPGGALIEIMNHDGTMARLPQLKALAKAHELKIITIEDLITYRKKHNV